MTKRERKIQRTTQALQMADQATAEARVLLAAYAQKYVDDPSIAVAARLYQTRCDIADMLRDVRYWERRLTRLRAKGQGDAGNHGTTEGAHAGGGLGRGPAGDADRSGLRREAGRSGDTSVDSGPLSGTRVRGDDRRQCDRVGANPDAAKARRSGGTATDKRPATFTLAGSPTPVNVVGLAHSSAGAAAGAVSRPNTDGATWPAGSRGEHRALDLTAVIAAAVVIVGGFLGVWAIVGVVGWCRRHCEAATMDAIWWILIGGVVAIVGGIALRRLLLTVWRRLFGNEGRYV